MQMKTSSDKQRRSHHSTKTVETKSKEEQSALIAKQTEEFLATNPGGIRQIPIGVSGVKGWTPMGVKDEQRYHNRQYPDKRK